MTARISAGSPAALPTPAWIDKWLAACHDLAELERSNPMTDAVVEEIDGRMIRVGDQWLADFASCNYLGFDLERELIEAIPAYLILHEDPAFIGLRWLAQRRPWDS